MGWACSPPLSHWIPHDAGDDVRANRMGRGQCKRNCLPQRLQGQVLCGHVELRAVAPHGVL
eukprot:4217997-Lingulodinium_polyedra.AAC.1